MHWTTMPVLRLEGSQGMLALRGFRVRGLSWDLSSVLNQLCGLARLQHYGFVPCIQNVINNDDSWVLSGLNEVTRITVTSSSPTQCLTRHSHCKLLHLPKGHLHPLSCSSQKLWCPPGSLLTIFIPPTRAPCWLCSQLPSQPREIRLSPSTTTICSSI